MYKDDRLRAFGERLKELREDKGLIQEELAKELSVTKDTLSRYERGLFLPDDDTKMVICDYFDVSLDYLMGRDNFPVLPVQSLKLIKDFPEEGIPKLKECMEWIYSFYTLQQQKDKDKK